MYFVDIVYIEHRLLDYNQCMYTAQEVDIEELSSIFLKQYKEAYRTYEFIYSEMYCLHTVASFYHQSIFLIQMNRELSSKQLQTLFSIIPCCSKLQNNESFFFSTNQRMLATYSCSLELFQF